jgi:hypothetical protein
VFCGGRGVIPRYRDHQANLQWHVHESSFSPFPLFGGPAAQAKPPARTPLAANRLVRMVRFLVMISSLTADALRRVYSITSSATVRQTEFKIPWMEIIKVCPSSIWLSENDYGGVMRHLGGAPK